MKKIIFIILVISSYFTTSAQVTPYAAAGLSMSNAGVGNFNTNTYPSLEVGIIKDNISFGAVLGRDNLVSEGSENISNYWSEGKVSYYFPIGIVNGYGILGVGAYYQSRNIQHGDGGMFIEYGAGISKDMNDNLGLYLQVSNWDGITYVTPGLYFMF